jgi:hypothetical protein
MFLPVFIYKDRFLLRERSKRDDPSFIDLHIPDLRRLAQSCDLFHGSSSHLIMAQLHTFFRHALLTEAETYAVIIFSKVRIYIRIRSFQHDLPVHSVDKTAPAFLTAQ